MNCFVCKKEKSKRLERHHIFSELYFIRHGIGTTRTYKSFKRCEKLCRTCHSQITSLNSLFRQAYWKMLGRKWNVQRGPSEYEDLMRLLGTVVWGAFLKAYPMKFKGQRRALVQVLLKHYKVHALISLRKAS